MSDITVSLVVGTTLGDLELEDVENGYELHAETFGTRSVSHRKLEVSGDWSEGTDVDRSLRGNIVEAVAFYVTGDTQFEFQSRLNAATAAFEQIRYPVTKTIGNAREVWTCVPSDYTIETSQPFMIATMGLVRVQLERKPAVVLSEVV